MKYLYILGIGVTIVIAAYDMGGRVATQKCQARMAAHTAQTITKMIQVREEINAETLRHRTDDIRRVLRTQYTIAD